MNIGVVLSGTIRFQYKSLATIESLRSQGHQVDVYIHTWSNVKDTEFNSWSHYPAAEPLWYILEPYKAVGVMTDDWMEYLPKFKEQRTKWIEETGVSTFTHYGMPGMWYSLKQSYDQLINSRIQYDSVLRLRFDCHILDQLSDVEGWNIPEAIDFGGINDQVGWYIGEANKYHDNDLELSAYFHTYDRIGQLFKQGIEWSPERLLKGSLDLSWVEVNRPKCRYTIHDD